MTEDQNKEINTLQSDVLEATGEWITTNTALWLINNGYSKHVPLNRDDLIMVLTAWGLNQTKDLANIIYERFCQPKIKLPTVNELHGIIFKMEEDYGDVLAYRTVIEKILQHIKDINKI